MGFIGGFPCRFDAYHPSGSRHWVRSFGSPRRPRAATTRKTRLPRAARVEPEARQRSAEALRTVGTVALPPVETPQRAVREARPQMAATLQPAAGEAARDAGRTRCRPETRMDVRTSAAAGARPRTRASSTAPGAEPATATTSSARRTMRARFNASERMRATPERFNV